jgi:periplasmic protein TonB
MIKHNFFIFALIALVAAFLPSQTMAKELQSAKESPFSNRPAMPRGAFGNWVLYEDYPTSALAKKREGVVEYSAVIGRDGRVSSCSITKSSGDAALDSATCLHIKRRAKFYPATDENENPTVGTYVGRITWRIPTD